MLIIPAIDLRNGKCVRLIQGDFSKEKVYSNDPFEVAESFKEAGAKLIHIVDLDGARTGKPCSLKTIETLIKKGKAALEVGGGIRDYETAKLYLDLGVKRIILGTAAYKDKDLLAKLCQDFPGRVVVGIDALKGKVAVEGWEKDSATDVEDFIKEMERFNPCAFICTDISKDGMLKGPNLSFMEKILALTSIPIVASGGVSTLEDIKKLNSLKNGKLEGVIIGKAIYEGKINLREAIEIVS
ncbi:MAG: 1-(5-phosphoribosyl)-5-[(5-phosphoribosylamino)methylideneamino]imidazole-4-carboxamide isomerase [Candidatus Schekmanbacteria bacterium]|nr:MAG: 1-(5-phosphoribosyl)-5-[(5-phosphoribosylamino)methylideneamino]imidazole-4-carboxamide isomerase [Candidatus Schekmanbacteria bacterium]